LVSEGDAVKLECYKLMIFLVTYAAIKGYRYVQANNNVKRKRIINEEYNRLSEEKVLINKTLNEVATLSNERHEKELKYNGLIIVKAFVGKLKQLEKMLNIYRGMQRPNERSVEEEYEMLKSDF
jgi:hypothetical protein